MSISFQQISQALDELWAPDSPTLDDSYVQLPKVISKTIGEWSAELLQQVIVDIQKRTLALPLATSEERAVAERLFSQQAGIITDICCETDPTMVFSPTPFAKDYVLTLIQLLFRFNASMTWHSLYKPVFWTTEQMDSNQQFFNLIVGTTAFAEKDMFQTVKPFFSTGPNDLHQLIGEFKMYAFLQERFAPYTISEQSCQEFFDLQIDILNRVITLIKDSLASDPNCHIVKLNEDDVGLFTMQDGFDDIECHTGYVKEATTTLSICDENQDEANACIELVNRKYKEVLPTLLPLTCELYQLISPQLPQLTGWDQTAPFLTLKSMIGIFSEDGFNQFLSQYVPDCETKYPATFTAIAGYPLLIQKEKAEREARMVRFAQENGAE